MNEQDTSTASVAAQYLLHYAETLIVHTYGHDEALASEIAAELLMAAAYHRKYTEPLFHMGEDMLGLNYSPAAVLRAGVRIGMMIDIVNELITFLTQWENDHDKNRNDFLDQTLSRTG